MTSTSDSSNGAPPPPSQGATPPPPSSGNIGTINIADEMRASYRDYSMSVIIGRALPDVRDGLKPVHRRILYAMYDEGLLSNRKYSKCAGVVGEVLKKYHPHGDSAVYDALVRMAQPWNMGAPLIQGQGNFGSVDGDPPAAYRYTEARLEKLAEELLSDIERNTVDFIPNFDGTQAEPSVLPSRIPNLIVNGSEGIAVAMATRCPPHNLGETVDALLAVIDEQFHGGPKIDVPALMEIMKGPDFPTGGTICGRKGIFDAFSTGRGSIKVRGKAEVVDNEKNNRTQIIIEEIPYQVNKSKLVERIAELTREKRIEGIAAIRDESDRTGMRIAIDLRKDAIGDIVLNQLYKHTALQNSFPTHQLAIVDGQPRTMPMRDLLENFIDFRREIVTRRTRFELDEAQKRFHLIAGLLVALDDIDRIIEIIRSSKTTAEAKQRLCAETYPNATKIALFASAPTPQVDGWLRQGFAQLDAIQAQAILDMRLSKLVGLERDKLEKEGEELLVTIDRLKAILGDLKVLMGVIVRELREVRDQYSVPRRTGVMDAIDEISIEDLIVDEEMVVTVSHLGYIKRSPLAGYRAQRRGGKGRTAAKTKDEDFIEDAFVASTHDTLMVFTDLGKVYWLKVHQVPQAGTAARGRPIVNLIQLDKEENVRSVVRVREYPTAEGERFILFCSRKGKIKKTDLTQYAKSRSVGLKACGIDEGDTLIDVKLVDADSDVILSTRSGRCVRFHETDARAMGRSAAGVKGIGLKARDEVVSMLVATPDSVASVLSVTEKGYGKRTTLEEFPKQKRGGQGVIGLKTTDKVGEVAAAILVDEKDEVMITTDGGILIRVAAGDVSQYGRNTQGVRILNTSAGEKVIAATRIADSDDDDAEGADGTAATDDAKDE